MSDAEKTPPAPADLTECTQASVLAEAAATLAAQAAARAAAARAKAEEARARAEAIRAAALQAQPSPSEFEEAPEPVPAPATIPATPAENPAAPPPAPNVLETPVAAERRAGDVRRSGQDRRANAADAAPIAPETERRHATPRRETNGRRATDLTDNSGIIRLGDAVRAAVSAEASSRRALRPDAPATQPGALLEPVAHSAGLHTRTHRKRGLFSPGLLFLLALMAFFGLYATGNLPQFDRWTDTAVHTTQAHNAEVVGTLLNSWRLIAGTAAGICAVLIVLSVINGIRERSNDL